MKSTTRLAIEAARHQYAQSQSTAERSGAVHKLTSGLGQLLQEHDARVKVLEDALRGLVRGYVNTLESGRDFILSCGGECDSVEVMENGDPHIKEARAALNQPPKEK